MQKNWRKLFYALGLSSAFAVSTAMCIAASPMNSDDPSILTAHTEPSERLQLSFQNPGIVKDVVVKEGDAIKKGQLLMAQDDDIEAAELQRLMLEASSDARKVYYELGRDLKQKVFERKTNAGEGAFNKSEIEEAEADYKQAVQQIKVNDLDQDGDKLKAKEQQLKVDKMKLCSSFDGFVESIGIREGEFASPDHEKPVMTIVQNNPCRITIMELSSAQVAKLKNGETLQVRYAGDSEWRTAKIVYIAPVADSGSDHEIIRLELPNPENKATGLPIQVKLPPKLLEGDGVAKTDFRSN